MSYKRFDADDVLISAESVTTSAWSGNVTTLSSFYTSSTQYNSTSGDYYVNVFNQDPSGSGEETTNFFWYLDTDEDETNNCAAKDDSSIEGFEFYFKYKGEMQGGQLEETFNAYKCRDCACRSGGTLEPGRWQWGGGC